MKPIKLVHGVGINNADYIVQIKETIGYTEKGNQIQATSWVCPFYSRWKDMLRRCYSPDYQSKFPTYVGCSVVPEWHYFMTFRAWMENQDWESKHLDKDILFPGNKVYGSDTCVFVDEKVNNFLTETNAKRGKWPIGVCFRRDNMKYRAQCCDVISGKQRKLGQYNCPNEAHQAWLAFKLEQAKILASFQKDPRVSTALIQRYENYTNPDCEECGFAEETELTQAEIDAILAEPKDVAPKKPRKKT